MKRVYLHAFTSLQFYANLYLAFHFHHFSDSLYLSSRNESEYGFAAHVPQPDK